MHGHARRKFSYENNDNNDYINITLFNDTDNCNG